MNLWVIPLGFFLFSFLCLFLALWLRVEFQLVFEEAEGKGRNPFRLLGRHFPKILRLDCIGGWIFLFDCFRHKPKILRKPGTNYFGFPVL